MKKLFLLVTLLVAIHVKAQECQNCDKRTAIAFQKIEWLAIQKPEDPVLLEQWEKLDYIWSETSYQFDQYFKNDNCVFIRQTVRTAKTTNVASNYKYTIYGTIVQSSSDYVLRLWMQPACSNKIIAETEVRFQIYPELDLDKITQQAAAQLGPQIKKVFDFELNERDTNGYGLGGDLWNGYIDINMENTLAKGEETRVVMKVVDCDGRVLHDKEISTAGTVGGIFTPAKFKTNGEGVAIVKFRMTTDKTAFVKASCETKNVWGCEDLYTGTEAVKGLAGTPIKVSVNYEQYETKTLKRATLPGIKITGGEEAEMVEMTHRTVFYHYPSQEKLKEGLLVDAQKQGYYIGLTEEVPNPNIKTIYVVESGGFVFTKTVQNAKISGMAGNVEMVRAEEKGEQISYYGEANLQNPSVVMFHLGNEYDPPSFMWNVEYPASEGNLAFGGATILRGEDHVVWKVNKIADPKSIYKTEYVLSLTLYAAEELKKGNKAMKDLMGVDLDQLTGVLDPTNPQSNMAGASGYQMINVRILSPYEHHNSPTKK